MRPRILRLHLVPTTRHTVYEAEIVGTIIGLELLRKEARLGPKASIALDNKLVIQSPMLHSAAPGRYIADIFHRLLK